MSEIKELKRFIYSATVTSGSGSQSFYIDAKSREEADKRAANNESDGMYADDSEVTDLDALEYEDETTVDDFGDFPVISREQALIAQLEAAQKELFDFHNQEFQQRLANAEHQLYMKDLAIHNIKASRNAQFKKRKAAEKELAEWRSVAEAAAQDDADWRKLTDLKNEVIVNLALGVGLLIGRAEKAEAALSAANEKLSKPVVLPEVVVVNISGKYPIEVMYASKVKTFIKAAGFTVEGIADAE